MLRRIFLLSAFLPAMASAQSLSSFAPQNEEARPLTEAFADPSNGMTEELFDKILDRVEEIYEPIVAAKGATLEVERDWANGTVNAYAQQLGGRWIIKMFGGLARHEEVTADAFALVACHELGHHLGGAPLYRSISWASNEGQSDYYATLKCARKIWATDNNVEIMEQRLEDGQIDEYALNACNETHASPENRALCLRGSMGGLSLARLLAVLGRSGEVSFSTPDVKVVDRTQDRHPAAQCRLDTYFQAALCLADHNVEPSKSDEGTGMCTRAKGFENGNRPLCWYAPSRSFNYLAGF